MSLFLKKKYNLSCPTRPPCSLRESHHKEKNKVSQKLLKGCAIPCDLQSPRVIKARKKATGLATARQGIEANALSAPSALPPTTHLPSLQRLVPQASGSQSDQDGQQRGHHQGTYQRKEAWGSAQPLSFSKPPTTTPLGLPLPCWPGLSGSR